MGTEPKLLINNISVVYSDVIQVLKGVSLSIADRQIVSLVGSNGAGKTTTLKAISGLLKPENGKVTEGSIEFKGSSIQNLPPESITRQGIIQVTAAVDYVQSRYNPNLKLLGYLVSRFKRARSYQRSYLAKLREHFGWLAFDTVIPDLAGFEKSVTLGVPITLHAPASIEAGIARRLFAEVERRISRSGLRGLGCRRGDVQQPIQVGA